MDKSFRSFTHKEGKISPLSTDLLVETPLEIVINRARRILIMITPGMIRELVFGFLFTEGMIRDVDEVEECAIQTVGGDNGDLLIEASVSLPFFLGETQPVETKRVSYSSCGVCGKEGFHELNRGVGRVKSKHRFSMEVLKTFPKQLVIENLQPLYRKTGGAHAAILFDRAGHPVIHCEDMGRHNALDKLIGSALINGVETDDKVVLSSGRASLEMILKAARAGFPVFVAMSRPTSRAVEAAKFYNITLVDLAKDSNRIYSHLRRIEESRQE
jgi:FdhD protein